ncbi:hypothetical protein VNO78_16216 [Psophocarpus tetragonolobus]|uniref:Uncharacterized protein n=1 Tax=Psophocarpus tetragonolobus TaxID=3891 RepID=A0AAN9XKK8_PSOTE
MVTPSSSPSVVSYFFIVAIVNYSSTVAFICYTVANTCRHKPLEFSLQIRETLKLRLDVQRFLHEQLEASLEFL